MQLISNPITQLSNIVKRHEQIKAVNSFASQSAQLEIVDVQIVQEHTISCVYLIEEQDSEFKFNLLENVSCSDISSEIEQSDISGQASVFYCFSNSILSSILLE
ncbi:Hypothetical_protein [Hexamita inflata]|uniref:Hypothetical_protein n=1 Tax=Hexamita inflata TaxID=28002 RepID=A0AA86TDL8_9EUKA|nr:Hypothetical protein HINF_LOCUS3344 [Hexamita inflata]CAI9915701.1 Hypothetical protein HINF_LOCUS3346 [Hexamita inflata]